MIVDERVLGLAQDPVRGLFSVQYIGRSELEVVRESLPLPFAETFIGEGMRVGHAQVMCANLLLSLISSAIFRSSPAGGVATGAPDRRTCL